ncbi:hypothetical protein OAO01_02705 [Oligoflexia bacterium]|nr:hypothetical protein [Oligoflexia bacterium]
MKPLNRYCFRMNGHYLQQIVFTTLFAAVVIGTRLCLALPLSDAVEFAPQYKGFLAAVPKHLELYSKNTKSLSAKQRMDIKKYGLRFAALHPEVWGIRIGNLTDNRRFVPIRPYYLRAALDDSFRIKKISLNFQFRKTKKNAMKLAPHMYAPVFDITFAGVYKRGLPYERAAKEQSYVLRLSAFPALKSGIFFASHSKTIKVSKALPAIVATNRKHQLNLVFSDEKVEAYLNDAAFVTFRGSNLNRGLISLQTSWRPLTLSNLEIEGVVLKDEKSEPLLLSGLVKEAGNETE